MDEIFRKELKADKPTPDTSVTDEPDDYTLVPAQNKGETENWTDYWNYITIWPSLCNLRCPLF